MNIVHAQSLSSRVYDRGAGLRDLTPLKILQTRSGVLFVLTQNAVLIFNGVGFVPLGPEQGLDDTQTFSAVTLAGDGNTIVGSQGGKLYVARDIRSLSLSAVHFQKILNPYPGHYASFNALTAYGSGVVETTARQLDYLDLSDPANPHFFNSLKAVAQANLLESPVLSLYGDGSILWVSTQNGKICAFSPTRHRCWSVGNGLPSHRWGGFLSLGNGTIIARTGSLAASLNIESPTAEIASLPDTSEALDSYSATMSIQKLENEDLITQSIHGIDILHQGRWRPFVLTNKENTVLSMLFDQSHSLWLGMFGEGIRQFYGYGAIENLNSLNGLSYDIVWGVKRQGDRGLWIGTNGGLDLLHNDIITPPLLEKRTVEAIFKGRGDVLWLLINPNLVEKLDTRTGARHDFQIRSGNTIRTTKSGDVWIATENGLYYLRDSDDNRYLPVLQSRPDLYLTNLHIDSDDTIWLTGYGNIWKKAQGQPLEAVLDHLPAGQEYSQVITHAPDGTLWVGCGTGLYHIFLGARIRIEKIPEDILPSPTVDALMTDTKNRLWVGTAAGIAVGENGVWTSADQTSGLAGDDIAQDSFYEDYDQSIWVGTNQGLSHILHPDTLLQRHPLKPTIFNVLVGGKPYHGTRLPYQITNLSVQLGLPGMQASARVRYRYRFDAAESPWLDLPGNLLTDPEVPYGTHQIFFEAYDPLTHTISEPISLTTDMSPPWWARTSTKALGIMAILLLSWGGVRLRTQYLVRQQQLLVREVHLRTADLEKARAALEIQARRDALTGLMNRGAAQKALTALLDAGTDLVVALIDIDHFKRINDTYGHLCGDAVLIALGSRLHDVSQPQDLIGRFGGEEYIIAIPGSPAEGEARMKTIITTIIREHIPYSGQQITVTLSAGLSSTRPGDTWIDVIGRADAALYEAKRNGRAQTVSAPFQA